MFVPRCIVYLHLQINGADAVTLDPLGAQAPGGAEVQGLQRSLNGGGIGAQINQRAKEHVAGHSAERIDVQMLDGRLGHGQG